MRERRESTLGLGRDREADRAAEIDPVGAVVEVDQHGKRVARAAVAAGRLSHRLGALAGDLDRRHEAQRVPQFGRVARDDAAAEHGLGLAAAARPAPRSGRS